MSATLVLNVGSSSLKYAVFAGTKLLISQNFERICSSDDRQKCLRKIALTLIEEGLHITKIGQRIVHGGVLHETTRITKQVRSRLDAIAELAPLHDIPELEVVDYCTKLFGVPQYAVFDTAFHHTIPLKTHMYSIPLRFYRKGIRKYGFHGISHEFVTKDLPGRVISCHLGSGCSICAVKNGRSIQNSMGFTPLDGLMMGTRCGSLDPGVVTYLHTHEKLPISEISSLLNTQSGLKAIGGTNDVRDLLKSTSPNAQLALDMYVERIVETIGSYIASLGGVDTIVFTAGTGERSSVIRSEICQRLKFIGLVLDEKANKKTIKKKGCISHKTSLINVLVIPTNEELAIAEKIDLLIRKT